MVRTTATGSLKDAGQVVSLCCEAALVGGDGLGCGGFVGKGRDREKKEEESGGESFHDNLLGMEGSRAVGKRKGRAGRPVVVEMGCFYPIHPKTFAIIAARPMAKDAHGETRRAGAIAARGYSGMERALIAAAISSSITPDITAAPDVETISMPFPLVASVRLME